MSEDQREKEKIPETEKRGMGETGKNQGPVPGTRTPEPVSTDSDDTSPHPFEVLLDEYPLREPSEDPVWSVRIVKGWMYFLAFNFAWMLLFLILGIFYE